MDVPAGNGAGNSVDASVEGGHVDVVGKMKVLCYLLPSSAASRVQQLNTLRQHHTKIKTVYFVRHGRGA